MEYLFDYLAVGEAAFTGAVANTVDFATEKQLKDKALWKKFAGQFRVRLDSDDKGWRGEYWGKMMRGGCLTYRYSADEALYDALTFAVEELLKTQDELGRISSYTVETEFSGWDMWSRKYVLTGLQHFYAICKDENLKARVLSAMISSAEYICAHIGAGKMDIRETSVNWGGENSCSILEPFVELYKITKTTKYLDFAKYIIESGGCIQGDLLAAAATDGLYPYQYPVNKAYETMSFFEGVLAYYEATGKTEYFELVKKFVEDAFETDRTVVGGLGGKGERFTCFYQNQTEDQGAPVQETCVTVTWIRLLARLYFNTGDVKYIERIERSALNAMWGSLNTEWNMQFSEEVQKDVAPLPFDSYSPLSYDKRGRAIGGFKIMEDGTNYGCCACIGAAGVALPPLLAVVREESGLVMNFYFSGKIQTQTPSGNGVRLEIVGGYPTDGRIKVLVKSEKEEKFTLRFRKPSWCLGASLTGAEYVEKDGYFVVNKAWGEDEIYLDFPTSLTREVLNGKTAFLYGPIALALDEGKGNAGIEGEIRLKENTGRVEKPEGKEIFRYRMERADGEDLIFTDYASSGKTWENTENKMCVWLKVK
ncbi:MAG: glycoside hydrolase family 127 protein [Clostridia bacterium]|nr:glycoside hydrolase family 127 protein [Clostridia bacterium]